VRAGEGWRRTAGEGRYARPEIERRFLVVGLRPVPNETFGIEDRYLDGTTFRLRRIDVGDEQVLKLTQKVRADAGDPLVVATTNTYLSEDEYRMFAALPAATLSKVRSRHDVGALAWAVDAFSGMLAGLVLAEVEVDNRDVALDLPSWVGREVTHDDRYSGGRLARASAEEIAALLGGE
jgi:adenylate cyclase